MVQNLCEVNPKFRPMSIPVRKLFTVSFSLLLLWTFTSSFESSAVGLEKDVLKFTNQFRKSKGRDVVIMRDDLNAIARKHSADMARGRRGFGHGGFDQRQRQISRIYETSYVGENVAYGASTGRAAVDMWKKSTGHRKNMLGNYKYMGIGTARDRRGRVYYTQIFVR